MNNYYKGMYHSKIPLVHSYLRYSTPKKHLARKQQSVLEPVEWSDLLNSALL